MEDSVPVKVISSPPPAAQPAVVPDDRAQRLLKLAEQVQRTGDHRLMIEYLRLRRTLK